MPAPRDLHRGATHALSVAMIVIGVAMIVSTLARGGGPFALGMLMGLLFVAAGGGRIYVARDRG